MAVYLSPENWDPTAIRHTTSELWAMAQLAAEHGVDVERRLAGSPAPPDVLSDRECLISLIQQFAAQRCLGWRSPGGAWPIAVGLRLHATSFGMAGYGMLSCETLGQALRFALQYAPLFNLKHAWEIRSTEATAQLRLGQGYAFPEAMNTDYELLELVKAMNLIRDAAGAQVQFLSISVTQSIEPEAADALKEVGRCAIFQDAQVAAIEFSSSLLDRPLPQREPLTHRKCEEACQSQLACIISFDRIAGRVRARLEPALAAMPGMDEVARDLCLSARSLRRRLEAEDTSFQDVVKALRRETAERLLSTTTMSTEAIAEALGYGDVANFRHAFKLWSGQTPRQFRERTVRTHRGERTVRSAEPIEGASRSSTFELSAWKATAA